MSWETTLVIVILVLILGGATLYLLKAKKRGVKCIGCPGGATCSGCPGQCGCGKKES